MKIAISGLSNSGKTTVFNALTGLAVETTIYATTTGEPNLGTVKVPDPRIKWLVSVFKPKKTTPSTVQYIDYLGLTKGDLKQNKKVFEFVKDADALVHVVRAFDDEGSAAVAHPLGRVNPIGDIDTVETELLFGDIELVEKRLEGIELSKKKGKKPQTPDEENALKKCQQALESERPLRSVQFTPEETRAMRHLQFMSSKPMIVALNIAESDLGSPKAEELLASAKAKFKDDPSVKVLVLSGKVEMDIAEMEPDDARAFLDDLGIDEPALNKLIRLSYECVGLSSFFTVGDDEVRAWAIRTGSDALEAAGKIHSDIQRGFIRAEVIAYKDFEACAGSMVTAKDKGLLRLEGKTYIVQDGDIINFRFNV